MLVLISDNGWNATYSMYYRARSTIATHTGRSVHGLFTRNIVPVVLDCLSYDGETKPPLARHKTAGRPKLKRMRNRSEVPEESQVAIMFSIWWERTQSANMPAGRSNAPSTGVKV